MSANSIEDWADPACEALVEHGWYTREQAFAPDLIAALHGDLDALIEADRLKRAGIGREQDFQIDREVRRDWIFWLTRRRPIQAGFMDVAEILRLALNRRLFLALFEFEAHLALYPAGAFYRRHFDAFKGQANRIVSLVLYLNADWQPGDGGELVLYDTADASAEIVRIAPRAGTLVLFMSEEIEHEVLPTTTDRASIAGWYRLNTTTDLVDPPR